MSYRPGDHYKGWQVGDRLRYDGAAEGVVPEADVGTIATIEEDYGFDYRFRLGLDQPRSRDGATVIRSSAITGWSLVP